MGNESRQQWSRRNVPNRVKIAYEVETEGAEPILELPFIIGVMADLSGMAKEGVKKVYKDRRFVEIDPQRFSTVMEQQAPRIAVAVPNKLTGDGEDKLNVELNFRSMDDFEPARIAAQVPVLNEMLQMRKKLTELMSKMEGNDALEKLLTDVLANTDAKAALATELKAATPPETK